MTTVEVDPSKGLNGAVSAELRGERTASGMTNAQIADASGLALVSVQRYLAGKRPIDLSHLEAMAKAMGLDARDVVDSARLRMRRLTTVTELRPELSVHDESLDDAALETEPGLDQTAGESDYDAP